MTLIQLSIKDVDEKIFREFKAEAARDGVAIGKALNLAMAIWIQRSTKPKRSLLELKPVNFGKGTERLSEEVDKVLYGD